MQENGRAKLVGEKTFGKGVIQNLQELRQGGIAVTIAKYETPLHNNINKVVTSTRDDTCANTNYSLLPFIFIVTSTICIQGTSLLSL